jgi:hypothetical protein
MISIEITLYKVGIALIINIYIHIIKKAVTKINNASIKLSGV